MKMPNNINYCEENGFWQIQTIMNNSYNAWVVDVAHSEC